MLLKKVKDIYLKPLQYRQIQYRITCRKIHDTSDNTNVPKDEYDINLQKRFPDIDEFLKSIKKEKATYDTIDKTILTTIPPLEYNKKDTFKYTNQKYYNDPNKVSTVSNLKYSVPISSFDEALQNHQLEQEKANSIQNIKKPTLEHIQEKIWLKELSKYIWAPKKNETQSIPSKPRIRMIDIDGMAQASGKRKTAKSFVRIKPGTGKVFVNSIPYTEYFLDFTLRQRIFEPLNITGLLSQFDIYAQVHGSGKSSQAGAIRLAVARALQNYDPIFRPILKKNRLLTSDSRNVERKHTGYRKARKSFAWVKR